MATAVPVRTASPPPVRFARRVLLAVAGLSPQVVTETLYALARQGREQLPTEVHVLTTEEGAERARLLLLGRQPGWFQRLRRDYRLPAIAFGEAHIHVLRDRRGRTLNDIRTPEENERLADRVTELVRSFTADPHSQLHVSLAGGRKTMGFYAGYALSLYGREQDRLSHVLVSAPFESHPEFFYPAPRARTIFGRDRRPLDAAAAQVTLAEIPFVRMRERLSQALVRGRTGFSATVAALNQAAGPLRLALDPELRRVRAGNTALTLPPREMAFYLWLTLRQSRGEAAVACPPPGAPDLEAARGYLVAYARVQRGLSPTRQRLAQGMSASFFSETKSRLNHALAAAGVPEAYHVQRQLRPDRPAEFGLTVPSAAIAIQQFPEEKP